MVKLRFIGKPGGKLAKGAPGNYKQGQIITGPADKAVYFPKIWQLAEDMPELVIPEPMEIDSVFEIEIPSEIGKVDGSSKEFNLLDPDRSSSRSFVRIDADSTDSSNDDVVVSEVLTVTVEDLENSTRPQLMTFIKSQNGEYKNRMKRAKLLEIAKSLL